MPLTVIYIEGNIGSGKSTLIQSLNDKPWLLRNSDIDFTAIQEPVDEWRDSGALSALYNKYINNSLFQMMVLCTRSSKLQTAISNINCGTNLDKRKVLFAERGLEFGDKAFAQVSIVNPTEYTLYESSSNAIRQSISDNLTTIDVSYQQHYLYLKLSPEKCLERIHNRHRDEEKLVSLEYLREIHNSHETIGKQLQSKGKHVISIDADISKEELLRKIRLIVQEITH